MKPPHGETIPSPPDQEPDVSAGPRDVTRYDLVTGKILGVGTVVQDTPPPDGQGFVDGRKSIRNEYIDVLTGDVRVKSPHPATLDAETITLGQSATISGLPAQSSVIVGGYGVVDVEDGELIITPGSVGSQDIAIDDAPYFRKSFVLNVDAAEP